MNIDHQAALQARKEINIDAPVETVWAAITDIDRWSNWQPTVSFSKLDGNLEVGVTFKWKAMGLNILSVIQELEPPGKIAWTGKSLGMRAIHIWNFTAAEKHTQVTTLESLSGWFPKLLKLFDPDFLGKSLSNSLQILKAEAERKMI